MRWTFFLFVGILFLSSCTTNYEIEELYGIWEGETMRLVLEESGKCELTINGNTFPGDTEWSAVIGNTLEFTANGKVFLSNVTIKSLKDNVLTLETRPIISKSNQATEIHTLQRVGEGPKKT